MPLLWSGQPRVLHLVGGAILFAAQNRPKKPKPRRDSPPIERTMEHANVKTMSLHSAAMCVTLTSVFQYSRSLIHRRSSYETSFADPFSAFSTTLRRASSTSTITQRLDYDPHTSPAKARHAHLKTHSLPRTAKEASPNGRSPSPSTFRTGNAARNCRLARQPFRRHVWTSTTCVRERGRHCLAVPSPAQRPLLLRPHSPTTAFHDEFGVRIHRCFHLPDLWQAPVTTPAAAAVPVLALVFPSLLTSLAGVTQRTLSSYVPGSRPGIVSRDP